MASPLYTAFPVLETATTALVAFTAGLQPTMVPLSVAKMNRLGAEAVPFVTTKPLVPLKTTPVGALPDGGMLTVRASFAPEPLYSVLLSVPLSETHQGLVALRARPQALTRLESVAFVTRSVRE